VQFIFISVSLAPTPMTGLESMLNNHLLSKQVSVLLVPSLDGQGT
jgi:hypothetical protein